MVGESSALQGLIGHASGAFEGIGKRVAQGVTAASRAGMGAMHGPPSGAMRRGLASSGARMMASQASRVKTGAAVTGAIGMAASYGAYRRKGSQNYPMY